MHVQIQTYKDTIADVEVAGLKINNQIAVHILLWSLPQSYDLMISVYIGTLTDISKLKIAHIIPKILEEESRRQGQRDVSVSQISQVKKFVKGPCGTCSKTNHSTEQH